MQELKRIDPRFSRRTVLGAAAALPLASLPHSPALAQFRVEVSGAGMTQIPFSIGSFRDNGLITEDIASIVRADLERSGQFRFVQGPTSALDENSRPDMNAWRAANIDALVTGSVSKLGDGRFDVRFRAWDVVKGQELSSLSYPTLASGLRMAAHRISDQIYEKLTGEKGVFATRIAYVTKLANRYDLLVAESDGLSAQSAYGGTQAIISPSWSPNGASLAYVSFESRKATVFTQQVATGGKRLLASFRGSNSSPAWAPDGSHLAVSLAISGSMQIYVIGASGGEPRRLSQSSTIDTEPVYSSDGGSIFFVSDRGGSAQVYKMTAQGGNVQRVTFNGSYNVAPAPSPDGKWLAYVSRVGGGFKLHVMDLSSGTATALTDTSADESPSFAPNSRLIMYATKVQGQEALMTTTLDGRVKTRLAGTRGDISEPAWGPFTSA